MEAPFAGTWLRSAGGRVRLGWRLALWVVVLVVATVAFVPFLPGGASNVAGPLLAAGLLAGWAALALDDRSPAALGFHLDAGAVAETALGLGLGVLVALLAVVVVAAAGGLTWVREEGTAAAWLVTGAQALWLFTLPAAAEEVVFRGYAFQALAEGWGWTAALVLTSVGFGLLHLSNPGADWTGAANVAAAGAFLGLVYLRTGSLWWATAVHLGWNWAHGFLVDLPVSGLELVDAPLVEARTAGPEWLSGGAFGPEGSVLATVVLAGAALWTWRTDLLRPSPAYRPDDGRDRRRLPLALVGPVGPGVNSTNERGEGRDR